MFRQFDRAEARKARTAFTPFADFDTIHSDVLRLFPELVVELGGDPAALLADAGVPLGLCGKESDRRIGYRAFVGLLEHAASQLDCPDFGMRLAVKQGGLAVCGMLGAVLNTATRFRDALDYAANHSFAHSLAARIRLHHDPDEGVVVVSHDILLDRLPKKCQALEQILLLAHLTSFEVTEGRARVRKVFFRHEPVASLRDYRRYFGCDVEFGALGDGIAYAERDLDCPIGGANQQAYRAGVTEIGRAFTAVTPPMHAQVRGVILQLIGLGPCSNTEVAETLDLHPRALYRRLKIEGLTFHKIKDEVRRDAALYYLLWTKLPFIEIASRIGFAEQSVFSRSCVHWFGTCPKEIRASSARLNTVPPLHQLAA